MKASRDADFSPLDQLQPRKYRLVDRAHPRTGRPVIID
jgi:hypothetical protein